MNQYLKAAEDIKALNRMFESVSTMAKVFEEVGSIEQARIEMKSIVDALASKVEASKKELQEIESQLANIDELKEKELESAKQVVFNAEQTAKDIVEQAQEEKASIIGGALDDQQKIVLQNVELNKTLMEIEDEIAKKQNELFSLEGKIEQTKASFRELVK